MSGEGLEQLMAFANILAVVVFPTPRGAEQVGVSQFPPDDGILQSLGDIVLTDKGLERVGTIFSC